MSPKQWISADLLSEALIVLSFFDGLKLLEPTNDAQLDLLQRIIDGEAETLDQLAIDAITFEITIQTTDPHFDIIINLPLTNDVDELPHPILSLSPNDTLSRQNQVALAKYIAGLNDSDILNSISCIESCANKLLALPVSDSITAGIVKEEKEEEEVRVWFWLQSLSTKSKRDDIVNWASEYNLTGFVLAGVSCCLFLALLPSHCNQTDR